MDLGLYLLNERFSQDPLKNILGSREQGVEEMKTPCNLLQCVNNAAAIRVQKSLATNPVHGNSNRKRYLYKNEEPKIDETPLTKRKQLKK